MGEVEINLIALCFSSRCDMRGFQYINFHIHRMPFVSLNGYQLYMKLQV
jgi:hypothetical protein